MPLITVESAQTDGIRTTLSLKPGRFAVYESALQEQVWHTPILSAAAVGITALMRARLSAGRQPLRGWPANGWGRFQCSEREPTAGRCANRYSRCGFLTRRWPILLGAGQVDLAPAQSHGGQPVPVRDRAARRAFRKEGRVRRLGNRAREVAFALRRVALAEHLGSCQAGALAR